MGNFLHKFFGYTEDESSCFRSKGNQVQPSEVIQSNKPPKDIEQGLTIPTSLPGSSPSYKASLQPDTYSTSSDEEGHSTIFPKVSVKRSLQNSLTPTSSIRKDKTDDYNNNNDDCLDHNPANGPRLCVDVSRPLPPHHRPEVVDSSSFHSIELGSVHSFSQPADAHIPPAFDTPYIPHPRPSADSVHVTFEPESLPNIDLEQEFVSPFTRDFALPQHMMLEVAEKSRPRRSNVRMSTRIRPTRNASDSRKNSAKPFVEKRTNDQSDDSDDDEIDNKAPVEENIDELPVEERRNAVKSRLSDMMAKRSSQMLNGEPNRYRSVYEFTDNYGRYKMVEGSAKPEVSLPTHDEEDALTASGSELSRPTSTHMSNGTSVNVVVSPSRDDRIQELLNSNHDDCDDHELEMEPIQEDAIQLRAKPIGGHSLLMEELKKRQSARQSVHNYE